MKLIYVSSPKRFSQTPTLPLLGERAGVRGTQTTMPQQQSPNYTKLARDLRKRQTKTEALLWSILRGRRLAGLKFRRQFPIEPFIADFACIEKNLIIELDGGYHDYVYENDMDRQRHLENKGWRVIRFSNEDVLEDVDAVAIAIKRHLGIKIEER